MDEKQLVEIIKREVMRCLAQKNEGGGEPKPKKAAVQFIGTDTILRNDIEPICEIVENADKIIVSELEIKEMVDLSMGNYNSENSKAILFSILNGKEVIISKEGIKWRKISTIPLKLQEKYESYEKELIEFGVKFVDRMNIKTHLENKNDYFNERVLDLKILKNRFSISGNIITVGKNTIVTELAKEYARQNDIKILKR